MEAAVTSIDQNIAEGKGRQYRKEFIQFLYVAEGSPFEVLTLTKIFMCRRLLKQQEAAEIRKKAEVIDRKFHGLINSLRNNLRIDYALSGALLGWNDPQAERSSAYGLMKERRTKNE